MTQQEIQKEARQIIANVLGVNVEECSDNADFIEDLGADSLDAVEIIMETETKFDIAIQEGEADNIKTIKDYVDALLKKIPSS